MINGWHKLRHPSRRTRSRRSEVLAILVAALVGLGSAAAFEQNPSPHLPVTVEGTIRDTAGKPVAGATVLLNETGNRTIGETKTNAAGTFVLSSDHGGTYTVRAGKSGWIDAVVEALVLSPGEKKHVDVLLHTIGSVKLESSATSPSAMEFKDEPNFTVAGVTDWSNLGLHGSAASSKTSESLAKETQTLKSGEPESASPGSSGKPYEMALAYRAKGDFAGAREQVRKVLAIAEDAEGHRLLGELDERLNDPLEAVRQYEQAAHMDPSEQDYFEWGTELLLHNAAQPAIEVFTRGSTAHPKSARMLTGLGAALYSSGSREEAARRLCDASDLQPVDPAPYLFLGKIAKTSPTPLPCSEQKLARFAEEQPENALANYYYAVSIWKREKGSENPAGWKQAEALLEKAVTIDPQLGEAYLQLGILHFARGDFDQAIRGYQKAIETDPNLGEAHRQLGLVYQRTGENRKAQQEFRAYERAEETEAADLERQRRELRQFVIILKDQPPATPRRR